MSIREIKQLFCEGLNSKAVIMGSGLAESALRKAVKLSDSVKDDIWSNLPKYRLAHLLFRSAKSQKELEEICGLLTIVSNSTAHPIVLFGSKVLLLAVFNRLRGIGSPVSSSEQVALIEGAARLLKRQELQPISNANHNSNLQNDLFNMLELAVYFTGEGYTALDGLGLSDLYVPLLPNQQQSVWRIVEHNGVLDQLAYTRDMGQSELLRLVKLSNADLYYIYGGREFEMFSQTNRELKTAKYKDGTSIKSLTALHQSRQYGLSTEEFKTVSGTELDDDSKSRQIRKNLNELIDKPIIKQVSKGPKNSRFAIIPDIKIIGLITQEFIQ